MSINLIKINVEKVKGYSFEGFVIPEQLSKTQLEYLNLTENSAYINCEGEFDVQWDDDIPMVNITNITLYKDKQTLDLSLELCDTETANKEIEEMGQDSFYEDKLSSEIDNAYDWYKEN